MRVRATSLPRRNGRAVNSLGFLAVGLGAAIGAWLRWALSLYLNSLHSYVAIGTLLANLIGAFVIGAALAFFSLSNQVNETLRLFLVTGLLGGLTTFSSFSAESLVLLQKGQWAWALLHSLLHIAGSLLLCFLGYLSWRTFSELL